MKCQITVGWNDGKDDLVLCRDRAPEEVWGPEGPRHVLQAIEVLDRTYADIRAGLIAVLPAEAAGTVSVVGYMNQEQARFMQERGLTKCKP